MLPSTHATPPLLSSDLRDITTLLGNAGVFRSVVDLLVEPWLGRRIDRVAGIEARGFILGGAIAHQLSAGFVPIRKKGRSEEETSELQSLRQLVCRVIVV